MATIQQIPGVLDISLVEGDEFSWSVRIDRDLTGYTLSTGIYNASLVTPTNITSPTFTSSVATTAATSTTPAVTRTTVVLTLTEAQTDLLDAGGNYRWWMKWVSPGGVTRTIVSGQIDTRLP